MLSKESVLELSKDHKSEAKGRMINTYKVEFIVDPNFGVQELLLWLTATTMSSS